MNFRLKYNFPNYSKHILFQNALYETLFPSLYFVRCVVCRERSPVGCSSAGGRLDWSIFIVARNNCPATYKQIIPNPATEPKHYRIQHRKLNNENFVSDLVNGRCHIFIHFNHLHFRIISMHKVLCE